MIYQVQPDVFSPAVSYFNNGAIFPAGSYTVRYSGRGAFAYSITTGFRINAAHPTSSCFFITAEGNNRHTPAPGLNTEYATPQLCEAANLGQQVILTLATPSAIGIWLDDSDYNDNTLHGMSEPPIFEIDSDVPPYDPDSPYKDLILSHNPIIYARHNEIEGSTTAFDSSGNAHHGIYGGSIEFQQTPIIVDAQGTSVYFEQNGYAAFPAAPLQNLTKVTIETWFIWDDESPDQRIFDLNNGVVGQNEGKYFFCSVAHHLSGMCRAAVTVNGLDGDIFVDSVPIIRNRRYHVVVTLGNNVLAIFINGVKIQQVQCNLTLADLGISQVWISRSPWQQDSYFRGKKDETAFYGRVLTDAEILDHYITGTTDTGPVSKDRYVDDNIFFSQTVEYFRQPNSGGGEIYEFTISDTINFADIPAGPQQPQTIKDFIFFTDLTNYSIFPIRMLFKDQIVFIDSSRGSPHRVTIKDTLIFNEQFRHNQHKATLQDNLVFLDIPDPHWFEMPLFDTLEFDEIFWSQNNHQWHTDILLFVEDSIGRLSITNQFPMDILTFNETAVLRWSIANITIIDTLNFVEELHRILEEDYTDVLVFNDFPLHVHPKTVLDDLDFIETVDYTSSRGFLDELTLVEVFCVESSLSRGVLDTLTFRQYAAFLINGPDDPRNGGGSPGGGGVGLRATYRRALMDRLLLQETVVSDPAPDNKDCYVEVN